MCSLLGGGNVRTDSSGDQEKEGWSLHGGRRCAAAEAGREEGPVTDRVLQHLDCILHVMGALGCIRIRQGHCQVNILEYRPRQQWAWVGRDQTSVRTFKVYIGQKAFGC